MKKIKQVVLEISFSLSRHDIFGDNKTIFFAIVENPLQNSRNLIELFLSTF